MTEPIKNLFSVAEPWDTFSGFFKRCIYGCLIISPVLVFLTNNLSFGISTQTKNYLILSFYLVPFVIYATAFLIKRSFWWRILFSRKTTIVLAYNLESIEGKRFPERYKNLIAGLKNEIRINDLGGKLKVISCPPDIKLQDHTAAEAKTKMGLMGATILIWGHIKGKGGKYEFVTRYSFEFGHPSREKMAKEKFGEYLGRVQPARQSSVKVGVENFGEQTLPVILFILAITTYSMHLKKQAEVFLKAFKRAFESVDETRQKDLKPAMLEVKRYLISLTLVKIAGLYKDFSLKSEEIRILAEEVVAMDSGNYDAHLVLTYYYERLKNSEKALQHQNLARQNAGGGKYAHLFNDAYFHLKDSNFTEAVKSYRKIPINSGINILDICNDLDRARKETGLPEFLFAEGIVTFHWKDEDEGKQILKKFRTTHKNKPQYAPLISEVNRIIGAND